MSVSAWLAPPAAPPGLSLSKGDTDPAPPTLATGLRPGELTADEGEVMVLFESEKVPAETSLAVPSGLFTRPIAASIESSDVGDDKIPSGGLDLLSRIDDGVE